MLSISMHRAYIGSFYTRIRFCCYGNNICYNKGVLKHLFSSDVRTVNIALVLVSLYCYVNLHLAKFQFVKLIADGLGSNPGLDHSKHYNRSVLDDTYQWGVKFSEMAGFQCIYNSFSAICFSVIKTVCLWISNDTNFIADQGHLSSLAVTKTFTVDDLPSVIVIKEHVVQTQMVLLSDIFNHHKDLISSEIGDGVIFCFARYSFTFILNKKSTFLFDIHGCIIEGKYVSNEEAFLSEFSSIGAVNQFFVKFFKGKSKSTLQYDIWYIKTERLEVDIQVESILVNPKKLSTTGKSINICSNNIRKSVWIKKAVLGSYHHGI